MNDSKKVTIEDVLFHIKQLTVALESFTEQVKNEQIAYVVAAPIVKPPRISKYDVMLDDYLKAMASVTAKMPDSDVKRKLLNPSPSEIADLKYKWRLEVKREREEEKEAQREKQKQELKVTSYIRPIKGKGVS